MTLSQGTRLRHWDELHGQGGELRVLLLKGRRQPAGSSGGWEACHRCRARHHREGILGDLAWWQVAMHGWASQAAAPPAGCPRAIAAAVHGNAHGQAGDWLCLLEQGTAAAVQWLGCRAAGMVLRGVHQRLLLEVLRDRRRSTPKLLLRRRQLLRLLRLMLLDHGEGSHG